MSFNNFSHNDINKQTSLSLFDTEGKNTYALAAYFVIFTVIILAGVYLGFKKMMVKKKEVDEEEEKLGI
jgi:hypothetical protein